MAVIAEKENIFRFTSPAIRDDKTLVDQIVRSAQQLLVCQLNANSAHESLLRLIEEYTGKHWTRWGL